MPEQTIKCPQCGTQIPLTDALTGQIEQSIKLKYQAETAERERQVNAKLSELDKQAKSLEAQKQTVDSQVAERVKAERAEIFRLKQALDSQQQEIEQQIAARVKDERGKLAQMKQALENQQSQIEEQIAERLKAEKKTIAEAERKKILDEQAERTMAMQEELAESRRKLSEAGRKELELLKKQQELETAKENMALEVQRQITQERKRIADDAAQKANDDNMLKMREKDDQLANMKRQIDELKRKSEVGSQEAQGEALEHQLQEYLESNFPFDKFDEIKKGVRGADVLQVVHNASGKECGVILWESKNTKDFQKGWVAKLKSDQQDAKADIAVIMSVALPCEVKSFGMYDGVWMTDYKSVLGLATALRQGLIEASRQKAITAGRDGIKDVVYNYITSHEFAMHIRAVVGSYRQMKDDLESEKRSMLRIWNKRDKQISTILENITGMYGSIEGLVGSSKALPTIEALSLEAIGTDEQPCKNENT